MSHIMTVVVWGLWSLLALYTIIGAIWSHYHPED